MCVLSCKDTFTAAFSMPRLPIMSHITQSARRIIKEAMDHGDRDVASLGRKAGKDRTTICREIKKHRISPQDLSAQDAECPLLLKPPYVCNGCPRRQRCRHPKWWYEADAAHAQYMKTLVQSRTGVDMVSDELQRINGILRDGVSKGQSVHHIVETHRDEFNVCEKTVYNLINEGLLSVRRHNLPMAACRRQRPRKSKERQHKVERTCRSGRTHDDYLAYINAHPGAGVVEMDSVLGRKGGKLLLTLNFNDSGMMLAFIRDANTARSVKDVMDGIEEALGAEAFRRLFPVILTDNGSEFSDPDGIEKSPSGERRTMLFYCNPYASYEKPHVENNHENLRRIMPKGQSIDGLDQKAVNTMVSHVNSLVRKEYGNRCAIDRFEETFGNDVLKRLGVQKIQPEDVCLKPALVGLKE